LASLRWRT